MESQKITTPRNWGIWLSSLLVVTLGGCPSSLPNKQNTEPAAKVGRGDLPPLKIGILDCQELTEIIQSRWQEHSEQPIEMIKLESSTLSRDAMPSLDVILYPAQALGSLTEKDWIAPLPSPLFERLGGSKKSSNSSLGNSDEPTQGIDQWSNRWRSIAKYNGKWMALPLGAPCWVAIVRGLDIEPLKQLQQAIGRNQNSPAIAADSFEQFLSNAERSLEASLDARRTKLGEILTNPTALDKKTLVARFLWIMSTSESRYRGLIDPYKVTPRLGLPEFARSARVLHRLALIEPDTILAPPVVAWEKVVEGQAVFGIGWPRSDGFQRANSVNDAPPQQLIPILYNGSDGILASIGRKTRQSSMATEFMFWLNREDNRVALQAKSPRIEVLEIDNDANRVREDYREYQTLQRLEAANATLDMSPRFVKAETLLDPLADTLLEILKRPDSAELKLDECKNTWTQLIEAIGPEVVRTSLERATGLSN